MQSAQVDFVLSGTESITRKLYPGDVFSEFSSDPDRLLVSACCEKVVLPKLVGIVRASYDPLSTTQTNKLVGMGSL